MSWGPIKRMILYEERLREIVSGSAVLMAEAGTDQEGVRLRHMTEDYAWFEESTGVDVQGHLPLVVIRQVDYAISTDSVGGESLSEGAYELTILRQSGTINGGFDSAGYTRAKLDYLEWLSAFLEDMETASGRESQLHKRRLRMTQAPMRSRANPAEHEPAYDFWLSSWSWEFGTE